MDEFSGIARSFDLETADQLTEEQMTAALGQRISEMLDTETELLFSTLYRLDIFESKINAVLNSEEDTAYGLARLVVERQKEKLRTRREYKSKGDSPDFIDI